MYYYAKDRHSIGIQKGFSFKGYNNNSNNNKRVHINKHYKYIIKYLNNEHLESSRSNFRNSFFKRLPCPTILILQRNIYDSTLTLWWGYFHDRMALLRFFSFIRAVFYRFLTQIIPFCIQDVFYRFSNWIPHFSFFFFFFSIV